MAVPTRAIFLVRHGETEDNAARVFQFPHARLSARGEAQAERVAVRLAAAGIAGLLCSDHERALATAERVRAATGVPLEIWPELGERDMGALRGRPHAELDFDPYAPDYAPERGESWTVFNSRVAAVWRRVCARAAETPGNLAVVTHGLVCRSIVGEVLGQREACAAAAWRNASVTVVAAAPPHALELVDCVAHLD